MTRKILAFFVFSFLGCAGRRTGLLVINDVTTDPYNPPQFVKLAQIDANRGRDMSYPDRKSVV